MKRWIPWVVVPILIVFAVGTVWLRLYVVRTSYAISQAEQMLKNLQNEKEKESVRLATLLSPNHLEELAKTRFQLAPPKAKQIVNLGGDAGK